MKFWLPGLVFGLLFTTTTFAQNEMLFPEGEPIYQEGQLMDFQGTTATSAISGGFLFWKRSSPSNEVLLIDEGALAPNNGGAPAYLPILRADQLDFEYEPGAEASILIGIHPEEQLEIRGFFTLVWSAEQTFRAPNGAILATSPPFGDQPGYTDANNNTFNSITEDITLTYKTDIFGIELNLHEHWNEYTRFLWGVRFINLEENLGARFAPAPAFQAPQFNGKTHQGSIETRNHLVGFQIGMINEATGVYGIGFESLIKFGIYHNDASSRSRLQANILEAVPTMYLSQGANSEISYVGELGLAATWRPSPRLKLLAGYQLLWLGEVALAYDQVANNPLLVSPGVGNAIDVNGDVFFHGAKVQAVLEF